MNKPRILIVEDEYLIAEDLRQRVEGLGYTVVKVTASGDEALDYVFQGQPDLILMDIILRGGRDGIDTARAIRSQLDIPIIFVTAHAQEERLQKAKMTEPFGYLLKPFEDHTIKITIEMALHKAEMDRKRRQVQEALRESEARYRLLVENAPLGIIMMNLEGEIEDINPKLVSLLGSPSKEATKSINIFTFPRLIEAGISDNFRHSLETGQPQTFETPYISHWGREAYMRYHLQPIPGPDGRIIGVQGIVEDISEAKAWEARLRQAQKMEAIGVLAGGIAHDFNNILAAILGYTEISLLDLPPDHLLRHNLMQILKVGGRAKDLVQQILTFSRKARQELKPVELGSLVRDTLKFLRATLPTTIEIRPDLEDDTGLVMADSSQIHQLLINLCANAAHSMREEGGVLEVSLNRVHIAGPLKLPGTDLTPGIYNKIMVRDTGHGMNPETMARVFEPFFTTKKAGEGAGMGLAVVHGIVKSHQGEITVESEPGHGSTFTVYLPVMAEREAQDHTDVSLLQGKERLLFVDDEEALAEIGRQFLEKFGYQVTSLTSSQVALELFRRRPEAFDMVITDQTMPGLTGLKLAKEMLSLRPTVPIVLCTGFSPQVTADKVRQAGIKKLVMKPVDLHALARTVREILDRP